MHTTLASGFGSSLPLKARECPQLSLQMTDGRERGGAGFGM